MFDLGRTFLQSVERSPDACALVDGDLHLSYAEWLGHISRAAEGLTRLGVKHGDRVVLLLQNRWEMATLHWACQFLGAVATPLNWRAKPDEIDYCLVDADACLVVFEPISAAALSLSAAAQTLPRIGLDRAEGASHDESVLFVHGSGASTPARSGAIEATVPTAATETTAAIEVIETSAAARIGLTVDPQIAEAATPRPAASADDLSLMLYTSGTTGRGKGVPRRHRHERAAALAHVAQNLYARGERTLGVMPLYHTMGVRSLLAMAMVDGCFVCVRRWDPALALEAIERYRITCLYLVPTLYHDLLAAPDFNSQRIASVIKLGYAGASMSDGLLKRLDQAFKPQLFVNHYGSSEVYTCSILQTAAAKPGSAGRAGLNTRLRVVGLSASSPEQLAKRGEEGQIIAELLGDEAFEGYWKRPDADARALRDGWYFTGDTGFFDTDGDLFVTGRVDDMIISGGENISPVEIESVLSLHPEVDEVAVAGMADERWGQKVVAFVKPRHPKVVDSSTLDAYCRASELVNFKRPREYVFLREIPKSPVGKILRRKLAAGEFDRLDAAHTAAHTVVHTSAPLSAVATAARGDADAVANLDPILHISPSKE